MQKQVKALGKKIIGPTRLRAYRNKGIKGLLGLNDKKLRVGFIGCGTHALQNLYPALRYLDVELKAVCAKTESSAKRVGGLFGVRWYIDYHALLDKEEIDAVLVAVNGDMHASICQAAMEAGCHVFVEKPPARTLKEIKQLQETSKRTNKQLMVGFQKRFAPTYQKVKEHLDTESLGTPTLLRMQFIVGPQADDQDVLDSIGIHHIDLAQYFFGPIKNIKVENYSYNGQETYALLLRFENNALGTIHISSHQTWNQPNERVEVYGEKHSMIVDNMINLTLRKLTKERPGIPSLTNETRWQPNFSIPSDENQTLFLNGFVYELRHFIESILTSKPCTSNINDSHSTYQWIEYIQNNKRD